MRLFAITPTSVLYLVLFAPVTSLKVDEAGSPRHFAGLVGPVGAHADARVVDRLKITKPGVYENIMVDGRFGDHDLVEVTADNVVLRDCTIRNSRRDGIEADGQNILIESCKIHRLLAGTFDNQRDAHGITDRPRNITIRNCEITYVSGDAIQFDPSRKGVWDNVLVEHCLLWTGPLDKDYAGFKRGQRPGEDGWDSKVAKTGWQQAERPRVTFRNCIFRGWGHGQIRTGAALNLKEKHQAVIDNCVLAENDVGFRCRGTLGSAWATVRNCAVYHTSRVFRFEDEVNNIKVFQMAWGEGVTHRFQDVAGGRGKGCVIEGERPAASLPQWPYTRLPIGKIIPYNTHPVFADDRLPTKPASGWEPKDYAPTYIKPRTDGSGKSVAEELFGRPNHAVRGRDAPVCGLGPLCTLSHQGGVLAEVPLCRLMRWPLDLHLPRLNSPSFVIRRNSGLLPQPPTPLDLSFHRTLTLLPKPLTLNT